MVEYVTPNSSNTNKAWEWVQYTTHNQMRDTVHGNKKKKRNWKKIALWAFGIFIGLGIIGNLFDSGTQEKNKNTEKGLEQTDTTETEANTNTQSNENDTNYTPITPVSKIFEPDYTTGISGAVRVLIDEPSEKSGTVRDDILVASIRFTDEPCKKDWSVKWDAERIIQRAGVSMSELKRKSASDDEIIYDYKQWLLAINCTAEEIETPEWKKDSDVTSYILAVVRPSEEQSKIIELTEQIKPQFDSRDGSHIDLTKRIKYILDDPGSYKHAETKYEIKDDHIIVRQSFRAKNKFGALVKQTATAKYTFDGEFIEAIE